MQQEERAYFEALRVELGIPPDAELFSNHIPDTFLGDEWKGSGYSVEIIGIVLDKSELRNVGMKRKGSPKTVLLSDETGSRMRIEFDPTASPWPFLMIDQMTDPEGKWLADFLGHDPQPPNDDIVIVQVWQMVAWHEGNPAFARVRWHPERGEEQAILGLEVSRSPVNDGKKALKGLMLIRQKALQGRRLNTGLWRDRDEFGDNLLMAGIEVLKDGAPHLSLVAVAEKLGCSAPTAAKYIDKHGFDLKDVERQARQAIELQLRTGE